MPAAQAARQQNDSDDFQHGKIANKNAMKYSTARRTALRIGDMPPSAKKALGGVHVMEPAMHREEMFAGYRHASHGWKRHRAIPGLFTDAAIFPAARAAARSSEPAVEPVFLVDYLACMPQQARLAHVDVRQRLGKEIAAAHPGAAVADLDEA